MNFPITHEEIAKTSVASSLGKSGGPAAVKYEFMKYWPNGQLPLFYFW